ncbi:MAG: hypothetical protein JNN22_04985 [Rhodospirillales bacterium]|nr:hypothetical protein [Rhodospirillales bacterium]
MSDPIRLIGRLRAFEARRAIRVASHLQVSIEPHALVVCPLAMAGEDTTIHAVAIGGIGMPPQIRVVPDPRVRDEHYALIEWMGGVIESYYQERRRLGEFPQIWVSSGAAAGHLDILADRLRFTRNAPVVKRTGDLLTYVTERMPVAGQQALMTATGALSAHYCTGQQEGEDEHLGVFLTWLDPPAGIEIWRAIEIAERQIMGVKTDPEFDRTDLQPLLKAYNFARKTGEAAQIRRRADAIEAHLAPLVGDIYASVQRALGFLQGRFPPAPVLAELVRCEAKEFFNFMNSRDNDYPLPYRDSPKAAAFKISERELAIQNTERGAIYGDRLAQARAQLSGKIVTGVCGGATITKTGPRKFDHRFYIDTAQTNLHVRRGDTLALLRDPRLLCIVEDVNRIGAVTRVSFLVDDGMRAVGMPPNGASVDLAPPPPDWFWLSRMRGKMASRLATPPWTHVQAPPPAQPDTTNIRPHRLLDAVENLR